MASCPVSTKTTAEEETTVIGDFFPVVEHLSLFDDGFGESGSDEGDEFFAFVLEELNVLEDAFVHLVAEEDLVLLGQLSEEGLDVVVDDASAGVDEGVSDVLEQLGGQVVLRVDPCEYFFPVAHLGLVAVQCEEDRADGADEEGVDEHADEHPADGHEPG